jgi:hypothetical protein
MYAVYTTIVDGITHPRKVVQTKAKEVVQTNVFKVAEPMIFFIIKMMISMIIMNMIAMIFTHNWVVLQVISLIITTATAVAVKAILSIQIKYYGEKLSEKVAEKIITYSSTWEELKNVIISYRIVGSVIVGIVSILIFLINWNMLKWKIAGFVFNKGLVITTMYIVSAVETYRFRPITKVQYEVRIVEDYGRTQCTMEVVTIVVSVVSMVIESETIIINRNVLMGNTTLGIIDNYMTIPKDDLSIGGFVLL